MNKMSRQLYRRLSRYTKTPSNANKITSIFSPPYIGSLVIQLQIICRVRVGVSSNDIHPPVVDTTPMRYGHKLTQGQYYTTTFHSMFTNPSGS